MDDPIATNPVGWTASIYQYSATIPHAVTSVAIEGGGTNTYEYDLNGNMTCRIENGAVYTHAYNAENRASSIAKRNTNCTGTIIESWSFAYDGDGVRVMTAHFTGTQSTPDSTTAYYMGGAYEVKDGTIKKYYSIAGMMIAVNDGTAVQYLLTDHLGSTVAVTNTTGTLRQAQCKPLHPSRDTSPSAERGQSRTLPLLEPISPIQTNECSIRAWVELWITRRVLFALSRPKDLEKLEVFLNQEAHQSRAQLLKAAFRWYSPP